MIYDKDVFKLSLKSELLLLLFFVCINQVLDTTNFSICQSEIIEIWSLVKASEFLLYFECTKIVTSIIYCLVVIQARCRSIKFGMVHFVTCYLFSSQHLDFILLILPNFPSEQIVQLRALPTNML